MERPLNQRSIYSGEMIRKYPKPAEAGGLIFQTLWSILLLFHCPAFVAIKGENTEVFLWVLNISTTP